MQLLTPLCFFMLSVSYKLGWTAISSLLADFKAKFGPQVLLNLNIAYFFPSIPVLMLLAVVTDYMDRKLTPLVALLIRFSAGLGGLALLASWFPTFCEDERTLVTATAMVGVCYGLAFGTSYQIVSKFPAVNTVALTAGFVFSGPVVLGLDLWIKAGAAYYNDDTLAQLFSWVAIITLAGLGAATLLVLMHRNLLRVPSGAQGRSNFVELPSSRKGGGILGRFGITGRRGRTSDNGTNGYGANGNHSNLLNGEHTISFGDDFSQEKHSKKAIPLLTLLWHISPASIAIFLSVGTSMLVFPFFTYMSSNGWLGVRLPQVMFYVRLVADVLGRFVPANMQVRSKVTLLMLAAVKTGMVPLMFMAIFRPHYVGDFGLIVLVAIFWWMSGYLNTCAYLLAPTLVAPAHKPRAASLMTVSFQTACFSALMFAAGLQHYMPGIDLMVH